MKDGETEVEKLFIIGNGFDLAHGLPTNYEDFHNYLRKNYPNAVEGDAVAPTGTAGHHGELEYNDDEVVGYLMNLISRTEGVLWRDIETSLGMLDFDSDFDYLPEVYDRDGERNPWHEANNNEDQASELAGCVPIISDLFADWVESIKISSAITRPKITTLIDPQRDHFMSFNYTRTLEELYGVRDVCHIHGVQGEREKLLFGHGAGRRFDEDNMSSYIGCEDGLEEIQDALRKDTAGALHAHQSFFQKLENKILAIYSYGFSFGDVDQIYLKEIFRMVNTEDMFFYLNKYDKDKHEQQKEIIQNCGFCGKFDTFSA